MNPAARIHELVLGIDGVRTIYPVDPTWPSAAAQLGSVLAGNKPQDAPPVGFKVEDGLATVQIKVGTALDTPAPALARRIAAAVRDALETQIPDPVGEVSVQVCFISA